MAETGIKYLFPLLIGSQVPQSIVEAQKRGFCAIRSGSASSRTSNGATGRMVCRSDMLTVLHAEIELLHHFMIYFWITSGAWCGMQVRDAMRCDARPARGAKMM